MKDTILSLLPPDYPWADRIVYCPTVGSTNDLAKQLARSGAPQGTAVIAGQQTGGRGRIGRSFHSPSGKGLYASLILRPQCAPGELLHLTCCAGLAAREAVHSLCPVVPDLKWTNDLVLGTKKLGGILTELGLRSDGTVDFAILGVGVNCLHGREDFPPGLEDTAVSLAMVTEAPPSVPQLAAALLTQLSQLSTCLLTQKEALLNRYRAACCTLGREVALVGSDGHVRHAAALDIDGNGALLVRFPDGSEQVVSSGEVSVRGLFGYV